MKRSDKITFNFQSLWKKSTAVKLLTCAYPVITMIVCCLYRFHIDCSSENTLKSWLWVVFAFFLTVGVIMCSREINASNRFYSQLLTELTMKRSLFSANQGAVELTVVTDKNSALSKLGQYYQKLFEHKIGMEKKIVRTIFANILFTSISFLYLYLQDNLTNPYPTVVYCLLCNLQIQLLSLWQCSSFNTKVMIIENDHAIETNLLIKYLDFIPDNSLVLSLFASGALNLFAIVMNIQVNKKLYY